MLESRYEATIEKPTASARGGKSARLMPTRKNVGKKTARMQSMASKRGCITSCMASTTARPAGLPVARCVCTFSTATVASSTRMPTASARPLKVMMLIV